MTTIPDQNEMEKRLQLARLKSKDLTANLWNATGSAPTEPALSGDLLVDTTAFEAHVVSLERGAIRCPAPTQPPATTGGLTLDQRVHMATAERREKEQQFKDYCASLAPKKEPSKFMQSLDKALAKKAELGL